MDIGVRVNVTEKLEFELTQKQLTLTYAIMTLVLPYIFVDHFVNATLQHFF